MQGYVVEVVYTLWKLWDRVRVFGGASRLFQLQAVGVTNIIWLQIRRRSRITYHSTSNA